MQPQLPANVQVESYLNASGALCAASWILVAINRDISVRF